jgi:hypothetical protein
MNSVIDRDQLALAFRRSGENMNGFGKWPDLDLVGFCASRLLRIG